MMTESDAISVFVYGTLKQDEERGTRWPRRPISIQVATIKAELYDLGPYPAIRDGNDLVVGELWTFDSSDLAETLRVLDVIECYGVEDVDLYVRRVVDCQTDDGMTTRAFVYYLADAPPQSTARRITPDRNGRCSWSASDRG